MKNISIFTVLVIIFLTENIASVKAQEPGDSGGNYSFSTSLQTGFVYGQAQEFLYYYNFPGNLNESEFLSKLHYDMKPVFYLGYQFDFGKTDIMSSTGFFTSASFKIGIPGDSGIHENRDWQSFYHSSLTDYSRQTNRTNSFYWADISIGMSIPVKSFFYINPFIIGSWMHFSFLGYDGYGEYLNYPNDPDSSIRREDYSGQKVITYRQDWFLAGLGFTAGTKILYPFTIELSFKISPLTYCIAFDEHLAGVVYSDGRVSKKQTWQDYSRFGLYIEPGLSIMYTHKNIGFSLDFNYRHIGQTRGVSYYMDRSYPELNDSGAALYMFDIRFLVKIYS